MDDYREELIELIVFHSQENAEESDKKFDRDLKQEDTFNYFFHQVFSWNSSVEGVFDFLGTLMDIEDLFDEIWPHDRLWTTTTDPNGYTRKTGRHPPNCPLPPMIDSLYHDEFLDHPDRTMRDFAIHLIDQIPKEDIKHVHDGLLRRKNECEEFLKKREEER